MKIAILTLPLHTNYGGILQAYALQTVLERMGHEVTHLQPKVEYSRLHNPVVMPLVWCKRLYRKYFQGDRQLPVFENPYKWARKNTDRFISNNLNCRFLAPEEWNEGLAKEYDAFVVGSDQVWRPIYTPDVTRFFTAFLGHSDIRRIAYAASFGVDVNEFSKEQIACGREYLKLFSAISVREESGIRMCKELFDVQACQVLDPTMLLDCADYLRFASSAPQSPGNLMVYVLDRTEEKDAFIAEFAEKRGLVPFYANSKAEMPWDVDIPAAERLQPPLETWLKGFADADFVLTDSFHACVFSILFHKPFGVILNEARGASRIISLLKLLNLEERIIYMNSENDNSIVINHLHNEIVIDFSFIDGLLDNYRKYSLNFIIDSLE